MRLVYLLIFISFLHTTHAQLSKQKYADIYNLNFTRDSASTVVYPWIENAAYANYTLPISIKDANRVLFGKRYINGFPFTDRLRTEYQQRILLPENREKEGCVEFKSQGEHLKSVFLILDGINEEEKTIFSDTLQFVPNTLIGKETLKFKLTDIELLNIRVYAEGEVNKDAYIAFHSLNILIGSKTIDEYPIRQLSNLTSIAKQEKIAYINWNTETDLKGIDEMRNKRIIGFSESIHQNSSIKNLVNQLIVQMAEKQKCQLVLMEIPLEKSLAYNRYIQNKDYNMDTLLSIDHHTIDLLNELRSFNSNKTEENKIKLFGMDYNSINTPNQNSAIDIFDFIVQLNQVIRNSELDQLAVLLMEKDWSNAITFLCVNKEKIQKVLKAHEVDCILHILNLSNRMGNDGIERFIHRDSIMFVNAKFLIDKFTDVADTKTIVYGHAAHLNPISTFPAVPCKSFGQYMQMAYSKDYLPLLFLVGNGRVMAYDAEYNAKDKVLEKCPTGSVEAYLSSLEGHTLYFPLTSEFNHLILSRFKGSHHIQQEFYPYNLFQRYRGVFFIKNAASHNNKESGLSFEAAYKRHVTKIKRREYMLYEIRKRLQEHKVKN